MPRLCENRYETCVPIQVPDYVFMVPAVVMLTHPACIQERILNPAADVLGKLDVLQTLIAALKTVNGA